MNEAMTDREAMELRVSRRSYTGPLDLAQQRQLEALIAEVNLESGLDFQFLKDGSEAFGSVTKSYGMFSGVRSLVLLAGPDQLPHLREKAGYYGERLVLQITKMGLGTCWVGGTFDRKSLVSHVPGGRQLVAVVTVGQVKEGRGLVEKAVSRVTGGKLKDLTTLYETQGTPPKWFMQGVRAAATAPSAMNRHPVRFAWGGGVATAGVPDEDGFHLVDLGIAKLHFELAAGGRFAPGNGGEFVPLGK